jgi:CDP-diacylglycerol--serine O-phosphatidyltransferase
MLFDFLDGLSARLLKAYSAVGRELDSLADAVSFGVAPAMIIYQLLDQSVSGNLPSVLKYTPVIMPVCAALRLAVFNLDETQTSSFRGLPTPANAIAVISVVIAASYQEGTLVRSLAGSPVALIIYTLVLSLLMVTRIPLLSLKFRNLKFRGNEGRIILVCLILVMFLIFGLAAAPLIIPAYILVSLLSEKLWTKV